MATEGAVLRMDDSMKSAMAGAVTLWLQQEGKLAELVALAFEFLMEPEDAQYGRKKDHSRIEGAFRRAAEQVVSEVSLELLRSDEAFKEKVRDEVKVAIAVTMDGEVLTEAMTKALGQRWTRGY